MKTISTKINNNDLVHEERLRSHLDGVEVVQLVQRLELDRQGRW